MSSSVFVFGASGYIGLGVALAVRRAGYRVYGMIRNAKYSNTLIQNEIEPIVASSFDDVQQIADSLTSCSVIIDAVGFNQKLSPITFASSYACWKSTNSRWKTCTLCSTFCLYFRHHDL